MFGTPPLVAAPAVVAAMSAIVSATSIGRRTISSFLSSFFVPGRRTVAGEIRIELRKGLEVDDPLRVVLGFVQAGYAYDVNTASGLSTFDESDLRLANSGGGSISAAGIAAILERAPA